MKQTYVIIQWPEVQELMTETWFRDESFLANPINDAQNWVGDSAYFVPQNRLMESKGYQEQVF